MKFNLPLPQPKEELPDNREVTIGNVYRCHGGGKTRYWVVVGCDERTVNLLGINDAGDVTSTANYGVHVFSRQWETYKHHRDRSKIGFCAGLDELQFDIDWTDTP